MFNKLIHLPTLIKLYIVMRYVHMKYGHTSDYSYNTYCDYNSFKHNVWDASSKYIYVLVTDTHQYTEDEELPF